MPKTPHHEIQTGSVPETAERHRYHDVSIDHDRTYPRPTQRYKNVIDKPAIERHMPARPKISDVGLEIRPVEILLHRDPKEPGRTDRNIGIARKIEVDMNPIREDPNNKNPARGNGNIRMVQVVGQGGQDIRDGEFLDQAA